MFRKLRHIQTSFNKYIKESYLDEKGNLSEMTQGDINEILKGYIECALWTEEDRLNDEFGSDIDTEDMDEVEKLIALKGRFEDKDFIKFISDDIDLDSKIDAYRDIKEFIKIAGDDAVAEAIEDNGLFRLGMDIWFTRNGHGSGFFDHSYENEEKLTNAAKQLKEKYLYVNDNGKLYFSE